MIFDSHAHYDDTAFEQDRDVLLNLLPQKDVCNVVNVGTNLKSSSESIKLAQKYDYIYSAIGVHPQEISNVRENYIAELEKLSKNEEVVAVGEIGLDYHYSKDNKDLQIEVFEKQIQLAISLNLPILVHDRDAHQDTLDLLKKYKPMGVVHCFSGSAEMAKEILKLGMYIGVGGIVTFTNAKKLVETVKELPIEYILLETDAPYLSPVPFRGKRCDSSYIKFTAQKIAEIKNIPYKTVLDITKDNAVKFFNLQEV